MINERVGISEESLKNYGRLWAEHDKQVLEFLSKSIKDALEEGWSRDEISCSLHARITGVYPILLANQHVFEASTVMYIQAFAAGVEYERLSSADIGKKSE